MKRTLLVLGIAAMAMLTATVARAQLCGPDVKHSTRRVEGKSALEANPPSDKALLLVLAPTYESGSIQMKLSATLTSARVNQYKQMKLSADRVWVGVNQYKSYFVAALEPGEYDFCSKSGDNVFHLTMTLEAGQKYFLTQSVVVGNGFGRKGNRLDEITAEDAAVLLKKCKRMEFYEKK
jgi:hypothetical protein